VSERAIFARQARYRSCIQADLRPNPILAVITIGDTETKRDTVKSTDLAEVIADLVDLLLAPFGFDFFGRQRR
jgi:hypothetical protein